MKEIKPFVIGKNVSVYPETNEVRLRKGDTVKSVKLEPRVMQVLLLLAEHDGEVIAREQFLDEVWDNYKSADEALTQAISLLRKKINDSDSNNRIIETVPKKGYKLNKSIEVIESIDEAETKKNNSTEISANQYIWMAVALVIILLLIVALILYSTNNVDSIAPVAPKTESIK